MATGLPTVTWTRIPETKTLYKAERSYTLYDKKGRAVRTFTNNYVGGFTYIPERKFDRLLREFGF
jgi:hypothetical protein